MTKEEHTATMATLRALITSEVVDLPQIETIFATLGNDNDAQNGSIADFTQKNVKLTENNVKLQGFNMDIFSKLGVQNSAPKDGVITEPEVPVKLEFNALFDAQGGLL